MSSLDPIQTGKLPTKVRSVRQWIRLLLGIGLLAAAAVYISHMLRGQATELRTAFGALSPLHHAAGLLLATLTLACPTAYHVLSVERLAPIRGARRRIAAAYALSQLVRYVPGKIFGVFFEVNFLRGSVDANALVLANTVQMSYQYAAAGLFALLAASVFLGGSESLWGLAAIAIAAVYVAHRQGWSERTLLWIARKTPILGSLVTASVRPRHAPLASTVWLVMEWLFFIGMWYVFDLGTLRMTPYVLLAACYAIASILGALAIVVPSGLVVREGLFIWLAHTIGFDPIALVTYAALIRIWLTAGDVFVATIFILIEHFRGTKTHA